MVLSFRVVVERPAEGVLAIFVYEAGRGGRFDVWHINCLVTGLFVHSARDDAETMRGRCGDDAGTMRGRSAADHAGLQGLGGAGQRERGG